MLPRMDFDFEAPPLASLGVPDSLAESGRFHEEMFEVLVSIRKLSISTRSRQR